MKRSLNIDVPKHNKVILQSPLAYAGIQNRGGVIRPGTGPLKARLLAVPLNADARRMMDSLGASVSLKKLPEQLLLIQTRRGRFVLIRQLKQQFREMKQQRHVKGAGRKHRMFSGQVLFVLLPKATIQPNPPPEGYAPRWGDPEVRAGLGMAMRQHMRQSSGG